MVYLIIVWIYQAIFEEASRRPKFLEKFKAWVWAFENSSIFVLSLVVKIGMESEAWLLGWSRLQGIESNAFFVPAPK